VDHKLLHFAPCTAVKAINRVMRAHPKSGRTGSLYFLGLAARPAAGRRWVRLASRRTEFFAGPRRELVRIWVPILKTCGNNSSMAVPTSAGKRGRAPENPDARRFRAAWFLSRRATVGPGMSMRTINLGLQNCCPIQGRQNRAAGPRKHYSSRPTQLYQAPTKYFGPPNTETSKKKSTSNRSALRRPEALPGSRFFMANTLGVCWDRAEAGFWPFPRKRGLGFWRTKMRDEGARPARDGFLG